LVLVVEPEGEIRMWKWTELSRFANFCRQICEKLDLEYEDEFDQIRWAIEENICRNPLTISHPDPRFTDENRRFFRTAEAPAHTSLPPLVVIFRVVRYPEMGAKGVLEGREVWVEEELRETGFSLEANRPAASGLE
jgi:NAD dependent epimerase/dehydratase family enzyme